MKSLFLPQNKHTTLAKEKRVFDFASEKARSELFTKVFYRVRQAQLSGKRFFVNYGGSGSSKSVSQHQNELLNLLDAKTKYDILIMRKVGADIYDSNYKLLENIAVQMGIYNKFTWNFSGAKRQIKNKKTGRRIIFKGADDINKLKSIVGIGRIILEEADSFEFSDFKEINRRARGFENIQIVFILNPVDEEHWIKKYFVDEPTLNDPTIGVYKERTHINHSTYLDNRFLTEDDKRELELMKLVDENEYNIYALGKWGKLLTGSEYYPQFKESKHVGKFRYIKELPVIHLAYDFNVLPYMTLLCCQFIEDADTIRFRVFSEYCLSSPFNTTVAVSEAFADDYEKYIKDLFYYGDASGNNRIAGKGDSTNYDDVREALRRFLDNSSDRTTHYNKPVLKRRRLIMTALAGQLMQGHKRVLIEIDESCKNTINDFKYLRLGPNGKFKEETKENGVKFQKYGHCTDAFEYCFTTLFEELL